MSNPASYGVTYAQTQEINCRECGAVPGQRCQSKFGNPSSKPHFYRCLDRRNNTDPGESLSQFEKAFAYASEKMSEHLSTLSETEIMQLKDSLRSYW